MTVNNNFNPNNSIYYTSNTINDLSQEQLGQGLFLGYYPSFGDPSNINAQLDPNTQGLGQNYSSLGDLGYHVTHENSSNTNAQFNPSTQGLNQDYSSFENPSNTSFYTHVQHQSDEFHTNIQDGSNGAIQVNTNRNKRQRLPNKKQQLPNKRQRLETIDSNDAHKGKRNLSMSALSKQIGIGPSTLSRILNGNGETTRENHLQKIQQYFLSFFDSNSFPVLSSTIFLPENTNRMFTITPFIREEIKACVNKILGNSQPASDCVPSYENSDNTIVQVNLNSQGLGQNYSSFGNSWNSSLYTDMQDHSNRLYTNIQSSSNSATRFSINLSETQGPEAIDLNSVGAVNRKLDMKAIANQIGIQYSTLMRIMNGNAINTKEIHMQKMQQYFSEVLDSNEFPVLSSTVFSTQNELKIFHITPILLEEIKTCVNKIMGNSQPNSDYAPSSENSSNTNVQVGLNSQGLDQSYDHHGEPLQKKAGMVQKIVTKTFAKSFTWLNKEFDLPADSLRRMISGSFKQARLTNLIKIQKYFKNKSLEESKFPLLSGIASWQGKLIDLTPGLVKEIKKGINELFELESTLAKTIGSD